jgi:multiple antibiotic resistance protein
VTICSILFLAIVLLSHQLMRILGRRGLIATERLMGMLLTAIAVQMFLTGVVNFIHST